MPVATRTTKPKAAPAGLGVTLPNNLRPFASLLAGQALPSAPDYSKLSSLVGMPGERYNPFEVSTQLAQVLKRPQEAIDPLAALREANLAASKQPAQADFALARAAGEAAGANERLKLQFPDGFVPVNAPAITLAPQAVRTRPEFPTRPAPQTDTPTGILALLAGLIDPVGAGGYNAAPIQAGTQVAEQQFGDKKDAFRYAVDTADTQYEDALRERDAQFRAATANAARSLDVQQYNDRQRGVFGEAGGNAAGATAAKDALSPLVTQTRDAQAGGADASTIGTFLDLTGQAARTNNAFELSDWENRFNRVNTEFYNSLKLLDLDEKQRNNSLDFLSSLLRPSFDPLLDTRREVMQSQVGLNNARKRGLLDDGTGAGSGGMTPHQALSLLLRGANMGVDLSGQVGMNVPGLSNVISGVNADRVRKATAIQMRDPRMKKAQSEYDVMLRARNAASAKYQELYSTGKIKPGTAEYESYKLSVDRANMDLIGAGQRWDAAYAAMTQNPAVPKTLGTSVPAPKKKPVAPKVPKVPTEKIVPAASKTTAPSGKKKLTYNAVTGQFQ